MYVGMYVFMYLSIERENMSRKDRVTGKDFPADPTTESPRRPACELFFFFF